MGVNRASNISVFNNSNFNLTNSIGVDNQGNSIETIRTVSGFIGNQEYEYGTGFRMGADFYYYPFSIPIGVFGSISYEFINFSSSTKVDDIEISPMRLGILFDLKNKEKDKPAVTIQAFIDRTDLNKSPTGDNGDLRFGLGVGLPVTF